MKLIFSEHTWEDYLYWQTTERKILKRINTLISHIKRSPFDGIGKPEPLKHGLNGYWSRRINDEHRLVYKTQSASVLILFILEIAGSLSAPFSPIMYYSYTHGLQDLTASLHFQ